MITNPTPVHSLQLEMLHPAECKLLQTGPSPTKIVIMARVEAKPGSLEMLQCEDDEPVGGIAAWAKTGGHAPLLQVPAGKQGGKCGVMDGTVHMTGNTSKQLYHV